MTTAWTGGQYSVLRVLLALGALGVLLGSRWPVIATLLGLAPIVLLAIGARDRIASPVLAAWIVVAAWSWPAVAMSIVLLLHAALPPGRLVLKTGHAQIEFYSGATVILEGPAEFRVVSRTEGYCASGKLRATVPPQAHGFRIGSPSVNLVDRGTEFGLNVTGGKTAVHVFKGEVHLYAPAAADGSDRRRVR